MAFVDEDVRAQARVRLANDDEWIFNEGDDDRWLERVLWFAVATKFYVEVIGDQWFSLSLERLNSKTHLKDNVQSWECDDILDGLCAAYLWMCGVEEQLLSDT